MNNHISTGEYSSTLYQYPFLTLSFPLKLFLAIGATLFYFQPVSGQSLRVNSVAFGDTLNSHVISQLQTPKKATLMPVAVPSAMVVYGFVGLASRDIKYLDTETRHEVYSEHPHNKFTVDDYLQFAPGVAVFGLNVIGIKGKNNMVDRTGIYLLSNLILNVTCQSLKRITRVQRPDNSAYDSFPSGHTAEAFASAEFLRQEYLNISPWYGLSGYGAAVTTGYLRMYNNKHWLSDVIAGAGVGIISTKVSYWLYPKIRKLIVGKRNTSTFMLPNYQHGSFGAGVLKIF